MHQITSTRNLNLRNVLLHAKLLSSTLCLHLKLPFSWSKSKLSLQLIKVKIWQRAVFSCTCTNSMASVATIMLDRKWYIIISEMVQEEFVHTLFTPDYFLTECSHWPKCFPWYRTILKAFLESLPALRACCKWSVSVLPGPKWITYLTWGKSTPILREVDAMTTLPFPLPEKELHILSLAESGVAEYLTPRRHLSGGGSVPWRSASFHSFISNVLRTRTTSLTVWQNIMQNGDCSLFDFRSKASQSKQQRLLSASATVNLIFSWYFWNQKVCKAAASYLYMLLQ